MWTRWGAMMADAIDRLFEGYPPALSVNELGDLLGISKNAVYDMVKRGTIPAYRLGGRWFVVRDELKEKLRAGSNVGGVKDDDPQESID